MDHMSEAQIIELLDGEIPAEAEAHLAVCESCRSCYQGWVDRIEALAEMNQASLDDTELHRLAVLYRQLGPGADRRPNWIARLVRSSRTAPAAVRGLASGEVMEYSAGDVGVMLRVGARSAARPTADVVGQIETEDESVALGGTFWLSREGGADRCSDVDEFGEFRLRGVKPGAYVGTWCHDDGVMVVPEIEIGADDGS